LSRQRTIYIFMGPPGSGKGTLADRCVKEFSWASLSTGALCRKHISEHTEIGKQIDFILKSGKLISDQLVSAMVEQWLVEQGSRYQAVILDGYPRTEVQVGLFHTLLKTKFPNLCVRIVKLKVSDDEVVNRLSNRLVCTNKNCQAIYSSRAGNDLAPKVDMICDKCGSPLEIRGDDTPEVIRNRLAIYHQHDLSKAFKAAGFTIDEICAEKPFEEVFADFKRLAKVS